MPYSSEVPPRRSTPSELAAALAAPTPRLGNVVVYLHHGKENTPHWSTIDNGRVEQIVRSRMTPEQATYIITQQGESALKRQIRREAESTMDIGTFLGVGDKTKERNRARDWANRVWPVYLRVAQDILAQQTDPIPPDEFQQPGTQPPSGQPPSNGPQSPPTGTQQPPYGRPPYPQPSYGQGRTIYPSGAATQQAGALSGNLPLIIGGAGLLIGGALLLSRRR